MIEAMKRAYADRAQLLGDPDFVKVPVDGPDVEALCRALRARIDRDARDAVARDPRPATRCRSKAPTPRIFR